MEPTQAGDIDKLITLVEEILEENPEEFLRSYVQRAGNGGGEYLALMDFIAQRFGTQVRDQLLRFIARHRRTDPLPLRGLVAEEFGLDVAQTCASLLYLSDEEMNTLIDYFALYDPPASRREQSQMIEAHELELEARAALASYNYSTARSALERVITLDSSREQRLRLEFGFLLGQTRTEIGAARFEDKTLRWLTNVWQLVSAHNDFALPAVAAAHDVSSPLSPLPKEQPKHSATDNVLKSSKIEESTETHASTSPERLGEIIVYPEN